MGGSVFLRNREATEYTRLVISPEKILTRTTYLVIVVGRLFFHGRA